MPHYHLEHLDRKAYIASVAKIGDAKTAAFAQQALKWWDRHFSWKAHGCVVLADADNTHLCYVFYKIDRYREYLTIHNLFTPPQKQRRGYAKELLTTVISLARQKNVRRFKLSSVPRSLNFYLALGFVYWGITSTGDYYCDLPLPKGGLGDLKAMIRRSDISSLAGNKLETIYAKVDGNNTGPDTVQKPTYGDDTKKMGENYLLNALQELRSKRANR